MEELQGRLERESITHALLVEERDTFQIYQKSLRDEEEKWCLRSRSL
jgi:hypothetical protein